MNEIVFDVGEFLIYPEGFESYLDYEVYQAFTIEDS
jgi:hypothetical protein